jgi:hypothetical protein
MGSGLAAARRPGMTAGQNGIVSAVTFGAEPSA